jgi:hypothetical protein
MNGNDLRESLAVTMVLSSLSFTSSSFQSWGAAYQKTRIIKLSKGLGDSTNHVFITDESNKTIPGLCKCNVSDLVENGSLTGTEDKRKIVMNICQCLPFNLLGFHVID